MRQFKKSDDNYKNVVFSLQNKILRFIWNVIYLFFFKYSFTGFHGYRCLILKLFGAKIGKSNFIYPSCKIWAPWNLITEDVVTIGPGVEIYNPKTVYLGHHTILSQDAFICGATHDYNSINFTYLSKGIITKPYTWICAKAVLLAGVTCEEGSVLGASSVTAKNLQPWTVYSGNPAQKIKNRTNFLV